MYVYKPYEVFCIKVKIKKNMIKKLLYLTTILLFCFCKTEKSNTVIESSEKIEKPEELQKVEEKENYKTCLKEKIYENLSLGNYAYSLKITPDSAKPKNDMAYKLQLIREKLARGTGHLKVKDTVVNMLINKKAIKALYEKKIKKTDSLSIDNFHVMDANYDYSRASKTHISVLLYSIKDSLFCSAGYHFEYVSGKYKFSFYKEEKTKEEAYEEYKKYECY